MPIRAKLVIIVFVFAILPMFLLWARWQGTAVGTITRLLGRNAVLRAAELEQKLDERLAVHQQRLAQLAQQPTVKSYARTLAQQSETLPDNSLRVAFSAFALAHQQDYAALLVLRNDGTPLCQFEPQPNAHPSPQVLFSNRGFSSDDALREPKFAAAGVYLSEIVQPANQAAYLWLAVPLTAEANNTATGTANPAGQNPGGALAVKVRVASLLATSIGLQQKATNIPTGSTTKEDVVISPNGIVLFAADASKYGQRYEEAFKDQAVPFKDLLLEQNFSSYKTDVRRYGLEWQDRWILTGRNRKRVPHLSFISLERYDQAIVGLEGDSLVMLLVTILMATVAALTLYYLISKITDSIRRVTRGAKAIAAGELNHQIVVQTNDETRILAHTFNRMAAKLRDMIKKEGEQKQFESFARLSAVLTHDLKNQILSLSLLVNNMERKFHREGFREDAMRTLAETVNNLTNLVAKLSDPRTQTPRIREQTNLTNLVERVLQRTIKQTDSKYQITTRFTPQVSAPIDTKAVERVLENLVINALEAMPDGGALYVLTNVEQGNAVISMTDTGKGMTEEFMRSRLFQPFATTKKKGIGLGLYSCRDIIEQHQGRIDVNSQVGVGTEFRIVLPRSESVGKPSLPPANKPPTTPVAVAGRR